MKKKFTSKFIMLILSVVMIATLFVGMNVTASAAETDKGSTPYTSPAEGEAKIYGAYVNLGGDISMVYIVEQNIPDFKSDLLVLRTTMNGIVRDLEIWGAGVKDGITCKLFQLEGITPQCMGDLIDAQLFYDGVALTCEDSSMNDYSVRQNLMNIYDEADAVTKQLIIDVLEYGAAAQNYHDYKAGALVTDGFAPAASDNDVAVPENNPVLDDQSDAVSVSANVRYSSINYLLFGLTGADSYDGKVTIDDEPVNGEMKDGYYTVATGAIFPLDFALDFTMKYTGDDGNIELAYSVNDYCYAAYTNGATQEMKDLALALYNYGRSAHIYDVYLGYSRHTGGTATCTEQAKCDICGEYYGNALEHNYTYTVNGTTITESCDQGCGHNATITMTAPSDAVYNGNAQGVTVTGNLIAEHTLTYNGNADVPVNAGEYTATLTVGEKSVSVTYTIAKATPEAVGAPIDATYGQLFKNLTPWMNEGDSSVPGTLSWSERYLNDETIYDVGTYYVYDGIFIPDDTDNYEILNNVIWAVVIHPAQLPEATISGNVTYNGSEQKPTVTVGALAHNTNYTVTYKRGDAETTDFTNAGEITVIVSGTGNYTGEQTFTYTIAKAPINLDTVNAPVFATGLVYNGTAQALVTTTGSVEGGKIVYSLSLDGEYTETMPLATDAGTYTVSWTVECDENHYYGGTPADADVTIAAKTINITGATIENVQYREDGQYTLKVNSVTFNGLVNNEALTIGTDYTATANLNGTNAAGESTALMTVTLENDNYTLNNAEATVNFTIGKADPEYTVPTGLTAYLGQTLADVTLPAGWAWVDSSASVVVEGENQFDATFTPADTDNYNTVTQKVTVTGSKASASVTASPTGISGLEYTGAAQALVTAGAAEGGEIQYKLGENGTYSASIPTATEIGTYTVYWKVVGDSIHADTAEKSITVTISVNAVETAEVSTNLEATYDYKSGEAIQPEITVTIGGKELTKGTDYEISYGENKNAASTGTITITFKGNYSGEVVLEFTIKAMEGTEGFISDWMPVG